MIEFVCIATHERHGEPTITLEKRSWAYCAAGAGRDHEWTRIDPTAVEVLRSPSGNGRAHLAADERNERTLAHDPRR